MDQSSLLSILSFLNISNVIPSSASGNDDETDGKMDTDDDDSEDINETLDGLLMMVEDDSICSEDIENIEQPKVPRPCSFVAPPPPSEPPPPTTGPTETVDVGVEVHDNASLGPSSAKSSPVAGESPFLMLSVVS